MLRPTSKQEARRVQFDASSLDAIFACLDTSHLPGGAVGIAVDGNPVYCRGFGLANLELPIVISPTTRLRVASITKHFTALAYMLLCEEGRAGLDEPIGTYLPELHAVTHAVTVRQLMGNISGLRDVQDLCYQLSGITTPLSSEEQLAYYRDIADTNAPPGAAWIYNNGGWLMVSIAIERISGKPLEEVLRERIFEPIGMYDTELRRWDTYFLPNSASAHKKSALNGFEKLHLGTALAGEGGMVSTARDMLRWLAHMDAPAVGTEATWQDIKRPQILTNGTSTGYGLGLITGEYRGVQVLYHPGGLIGGNAQMLKVPSRGLDVVVLINRDDVIGAELVEQVLDACLPRLNPGTRDADGPLAFGTYRSPRSERVIELFAEAERQIASIDGCDMPMGRDEAGVLRPIGFCRYIKQELTLLGEPSAPSAIRLRDFGSVDELLPQKAPAMPDADAIAGTYRSPTTGTEIAIASIMATPSLKSVGRFGSVTYALRCLGDGIWRASSPNSRFGGILSFSDNACHFSTANTRALRFTRVSSVSS